MIFKLIFLLSLVKSLQADRGIKVYRRQLDFTQLLSGSNVNLGNLAGEDGSGAVDGGLPNFSSVLSSLLAPGSPLESFFGSGGSGASGLSSLFGGSQSAPDPNTGELPTNPAAPVADLPTIPAESSGPAGFPDISGGSNALSGLGLPSGLGAQPDLSSLSALFDRGKKK